MSVDKDFSSSDSEIEEDSKHDELLSSILVLGRKRKKINQRSEAAAEISEHHLDLTGQDNVRVGDLLTGFKVTGPSLGALKRRLTVIEEKHKPIAPPLSSVKADQLQRGVAYVESSKQASKWAPIVKRNRESDYLSFPLQEDRLPLPSLTSKVETFKPETEFEKQIASVLANSNNIEDRSEELTEAERQALMKVSLEEATERRKELQKMRALMSYYEQKSRRTKKIKSKRFHRIQRKRREVLASKQQPEEELVDKADRLRAEERMTLKHSRMAKWAKQQLARTNRSDSTQEALSELHQKRQTLKQKSVQESSSCSEDSSDDEEPEVDNTEPAVKSSNNPWLGQSGAMKDSVKRNSKLSSLSAPKSHVLSKSESDLREVSQAVIGDLSKATDWTLSSLSSPTAGDEYIVTHSRLMTSREPNVKYDMTASSHLLSVQEAFAGDDVLGEFDAEKEKLIDDSKAKVVDLSMPGWGTWGGQGSKPFKKGTQQVKSMKPGKPRRDANIRSVIISENVDKKVSKHLVNQVPWPFTSKEQFDKTHSAPLGRHWNTEATFQSSIKPRVTTAVGCVIEPIKLTDDVQDFIKRTGKAKRSKLNKKRRKTETSN